MGDWYKPDQSRCRSRNPKQEVGGEKMENRKSAAAEEKLPAANLQEGRNSLQERRRRQEVGGQRNFVGVEKMENGESEFCCSSGEAACSKSAANLLQRRSVL
jgi:hypothetical protein